MTLPVSPRAFRLMLALLNGSRSSEECDLLAGASNPPHYIAQLRRHLKLELPCEQVSFVTKDGKRSHYGRYQVTPDDKDKIRAMLATFEAANDG